MLKLLITLTLISFYVVLIAYLKHYFGKSSDKKWV